MNAFDPEQVVAALRDFAKLQRLREEAEEGCRTSAQTCAEMGELDGWLPDQIEARFERHTLVFDQENAKWPFIETELALHARDSAGELLPVGRYTLVTLLDGTMHDDYFVLDAWKAKQQ